MIAIYSTLPRSSRDRTQSIPAGHSPLALRTVLLAGTGLAVVVAATLASPDAASGIDPELVLLLRGMAAIKASFTLAAASAVWWRLGRPVSAGAAVGYVVGVCLLAAANTLIGFLSFIVAAAVLFHLALFGLLTLAWFDGRIAVRARRV